MNHIVDVAINWLSDPAHIVFIGSVIAALVPTPDPNTRVGKIYKIIDLLAINVIHAKETGDKPNA